MNDKLNDTWAVLYRSRETWVVMGNITSRVMLPIQSHDILSIDITTAEALQWLIQTTSLLWIGMVLCHLSLDFLQNKRPYIKPVAFLCGLSPTTIINIIIAASPNTPLHIDMIFAHLKNMF